MICTDERIIMVVSCGWQLFPHTTHHHDHGSTPHPDFTGHGQGFCWHVALRHGLKNAGEHNQNEKKLRRLFISPLSQW